RVRSVARPDHRHRLLSAELVRVAPSARGDRWAQPDSAVASPTMVRNARFTGCVDGGLGRIGKGFGEAASGYRKRICRQRVPAEHSLTGRVWSGARFMAE